MPSSVSRSSIRDTRPTLPALVQSRACPTWRSEPRPKQKWIASRRCGSGCPVRSSSGCSAPWSARRFGVAQVRRDGVTDATKPVLVACRDDAVVGMLQYWWHAASTGIELGDVKLALQVLGPIRIFGLLPKLRARGRVDAPIPPDAFYIAELYVDRDLRGGGVGSALLDAALADARRLGARQVVLTTTSTNPARRLYERKGFVVAGTRTDPVYERFAGAPGRILMARERRRRMSPVQASSAQGPVARRVRYGPIWASARLSSSSSCSPSSSSSRWSSRSSCWSTSPNGPTLRGRRSGRARPSGSCFRSCCWSRAGSAVLSRASST
ncbi:MAG: GNAT family N-acetyltransferase [Actinobacteria bacterium]|nr:GNAT family N-acetyltransferase [Actinomycetota bacterium]